MVSSSINASRRIQLHAFQFTNDYKPIDEEASYRINYWKFNPDTENYEKAESSEVMTGAVGDTVTVAEADPGYATKYSNDYYHIAQSHRRIPLSHSKTDFVPNEFVL